MQLQIFLYQFRVDQLSIYGDTFKEYIDNINDYNNGFAGMGKPIDAIEAIVDGVTIQYRVQVLGANGYYPWQNSNQKGNGMDGYAGVFGRPIVKFQAHLI